MQLKKVSKKLASLAVAGAIAFSVIPAPTAHADILGTIIGAGVQYAALNQEINYLDNEGRDEYFQKMQEQYGVNDDPYLNARLDSIMENLIKRLERMMPWVHLENQAKMMQQVMELQKGTPLGIIMI